MTHRTKTTALEPRGGVSRYPRNTRRGVALLVVLLLISMVLGLSYAGVRSRHTALQIQRNSDRRSSARQTAVTGLTMALKKMHHSEDWQGVGSALTGSLGEHESYKVTYTTGDASLSSGDPDYDDYPYRVTLLSTGSAADPNNPQCVATYQIQAVVRLIPRAMPEEPADWKAMTEYTFYQYKDDNVEINVPFRIEGPVRLQKKLLIGKDYEWEVDARNRYLGDLNLMRLAGYPDRRPFNDRIDLPYDKQDGGIITLLNASLGIPTHDVSKQEPAGWEHPGEVTTYRLYPGGKVYDVTVLSQDQRNVSLEPDVETNPLGIYYRAGESRLYENVTIEGTLINKGDSNGDIHVYGENVHILAHDLPPLADDDRPIRLPTTITEDDFRIHANATGSMEGFFAIWDEFEILEDKQGDILMPIQGHLVVKKAKIRGRSNWVKWKDWWEILYFFFLAQDDSSEPIEYFPTWLKLLAGFNPQPQLTIKPDATPVRYHWHNPGDPIYVPHGDDDGLRWDLLSWTENP